MFWCAYSLFGVVAEEVDCYSERSVDEAVVPGLPAFSLGSRSAMKCEVHGSVAI